MQHLTSIKYRGVTMGNLFKVTTGPDWRGDPELQGTICDAELVDGKYWSTEEHSTPSYYCIAPGSWVLLEEA